MAAVTRMISRLLQSSNTEDCDRASTPPACLDELPDDVYDKHIEGVRPHEYPALTGTTYLDHAGTTLYAKSMIESWTAELTTSLLGNPHSASASSQLCARRVEDIRLKVLDFFNAKPSEFSVVFVANATAAIKLVAEAFRDSNNGFWYGYHADSHTSLVGCRELASQGSTCFKDDRDVQAWISERESKSADCLKLVAFPAQSNMNGRRLPLHWAKDIRDASNKAGERLYTLLDAASLVSTSALDLSDASISPDFIALSFYKIFGFPDLGALIVRNDSAHALTTKRYFAGGTVDAVITSGETWHAKKATLNERLEEGTLPFHNILALDHAMRKHLELFGGMRRIARHTAYLRRKTWNYLKRTRHGNGTCIARLYEDETEGHYGPIMAFNLQDSSGKLHSPTEVEKLCVVKGIQLRTGGLCNPGGVARHLELTDEQIRYNYLSGHRCGGGTVSHDGSVIGVIRISFGAMSTLSDVQRFTDFVNEYFVEKNVLASRSHHNLTTANNFYIQTLSVFPIKSCAGFQVPAHQRWPITPKGLAYDRKWCLVHKGNGVALSQKQYPRMTLLRPCLDLETGIMKVTAYDELKTSSIEISLLDEGQSMLHPVKSCDSAFAIRGSKVCGDSVTLHISTSEEINDFFSSFLGVACCLARHPSSGEARKVDLRRPGNSSSPRHKTTSQIMLANESPILIVSQPSIKELNRAIAENAGMSNVEADERLEVHSCTFRANIVVEQLSLEEGLGSSAYVEDEWHAISITPKGIETAHWDQPADSVKWPNLTEARDEVWLPSESDDGSTFSPKASCSSSTSLSYSDAAASASSIDLTILGPCQRCQMIAVDQATSLHRQEPFSTLAKTRRKGDGRVWFGVHAALSLRSETEERLSIQVGDIVQPR